MLNRIAFSVERIAYSKKRNIFLSSLSAKKGFTLIELLIAITLVGMILLTISAVDIASRKFLNTSDFESRVQNEVSPILDMIAKDVTGAYGIQSLPGIYRPSPPPERLDIRKLDDPLVGDPTYDDFSDDPWIRYRFNSAPDTITVQKCRASAYPLPAPNFRCTVWNNPVVLARNIFDCDFTIASVTSLNENLWVTIAITARRDANMPESPTNPQVILETTVAARSQSIN